MSLCTGISRIFSLLRSGSFDSSLEEIIQTSNNYYRLLYPFTLANILLRNGSEKWEAILPSAQLLPVEITLFIPDIFLFGCSIWSSCALSDSSGLHNYILNHSFPCTNLQLWPTFLFHTYMTLPLTFLVPAVQVSLSFHDHHITHRSWPY